MDCIEHPKALYRVSLRQRHVKRMSADIYAQWPTPIKPRGIYQPNQNYCKAIMGCASGSHVSILVEIGEDLAIFRGETGHVKCHLAPVTKGTAAPVCL